MARDDRRSKKPQASPEELAAALAQFNQGVEVTKEEERHQQKVNQADRRRKQAAAEMKQVLDGDPSPAEREAAEAEYRAAVDAWQALVSGPEGDSDDASDAPGTEDVESADTTEPAADAAPDEGESGSVDGDEQPATT